MKPRILYYGDTSAYRAGTGWQLRLYHYKRSRISGNWLDMFCSTFAAPRGLAANNYATAVSFINEPVGVCLTPKEVSGRLRVCRRTIEREIASGKLRALKIGRSVRILETDLQAYVARLRGEPPQPYSS